jgi:hypothetical protein
MDHLQYASMMKYYHETRKVREIQKELIDKNKERVILAAHDFDWIGNGDTITHKDQLIVLHKSMMNILQNENIKDSEFVRVLEELYIAVSAASMQVVSKHGPLPLPNVDGTHTISPITDDIYSHVKEFQLREMNYGNVKQRTMVGTHGTYLLQAANWPHHCEQEFIDRISKVNVRGLSDPMGRIQLAKPAIMFANAYGHKLTARL